MTFQGPAEEITVPDNVSWEDTNIWTVYLGTVSFDTVGNGFWFFEKGTEKFGLTSAGVLEAQFTCNTGACTGAQTVTGTTVITAGTIYDNLYWSVDLGAAADSDIYINNAPAGVYRPVCLKIDFTAHEATETVVLRTYYRIGDGLGLIQQDEVTYIGAPTVPLINIDFEPNRFGIQVTIEKTAGTNRAYPWEVFYEVAP